MLIYWDPNAELKFVRLFLSILLSAKSLFLLSLPENQTIIGRCALFSCLLDTSTCNRCEVEI